MKFIRFRLVGKWKISRIDVFFRKRNEKDEAQEEGKGAGEEEKKFAANGVSLMNAFFVSGKQRGSEPILPGSCAVR